MNEAILVLEDGTTYAGRAWGARGETFGELVFTTAMTGYQETFTDPSYHRQILVMTAPHIGNTGVNDTDPESGRFQVAGLVVRDPDRRASNWRSQRSLDEELVAQHVVGIAGVDTRAITRRLREAGVMRAGIFSGDAVGGDLVGRVRAIPPMAGADLAGEVSTREAYTVAPQGDPVATVVAVDLGIKAMTPQQLAARGVRVHVVPNTTTIEQITAYEPDGVFFSNGPGDPAAATREVDLARAVLDREIPFFGICFGSQILGRALGFGTYKLRFGHRGVNQPVLERATGRVAITAHNHGFALDVPGEATGPYGRVRVSHICLNDGVVEGIECLDRPAFAVQFHPEAAAGPHDAAPLFDRFVELMRKEN
jgi:carbamoyl-phosphate synthase small subunit